MCTTSERLCKLYGAEVACEFGTKRSRNEVLSGNQNFRNLLQRFFLSGYKIKSFPLFLFRSSGGEISEYESSYEKRSRKQQSERKSSQKCRHSTCGMFFRAVQRGTSAALQSRDQNNPWLRY